MIRDKKGLSAVITTLITILLVLVAIGIVWVVVRGIVERGSESVDISAKCMDIDVRAVSVRNTSLTDYDVTLERKAGGEAIAGVKVVLFNGTANSGVVEFGSAIGELETSTANLAGVPNANKIQTTAYLQDASGNDKACSQTNEFNF